MKVPTPLRRVFTYRCLYIDLVAEVLPGHTRTGQSYSTHTRNALLQALQPSFLPLGTRLP
jgi:hypothetical protein